MNEQQVNALIAAMSEQTAAQIEQNAAINRLADSNEMLCNLIVQSIADDDVDITSINDHNPVYLSNKPRG